jgi:hypothetical protein
VALLVLAQNGIVLAPPKVGPCAARALLSPACELCPRPPCPPPGISLAPEENAPHAMQHALELRFVLAVVDSDSDGNSCRSIPGGSVVYEIDKFPRKEEVT